MSADGLAIGAGFEGGWLAEGLADDAVLECGICWRVYDPKAGDTARGVEPGTPFLALPTHWHCPECDAEKAKFMLVDAGHGPKRGPVVHDMQARLDALLNAYRDADLAMNGLPIYNSHLKIAAYGFRPFDNGYVGALATPWFLNLIFLPHEKSEEQRPNGATRAVGFPSGQYVFSWVKLERVGSFEFCSLFSPVLEFENQSAMMMAAEAALEGLFTPQAAPTPALPSEPVDASRRTLLFGRRRAVADASP